MKRQELETYYRLERRLNNNWVSKVSDDWNHPLFAMHHAFSPSGKYGWRFSHLCQRHKVPYRDICAIVRRRR